MKKLNALLLLTLLFGSCVKQEEIVDRDDKWNGYFKYLKQGEVVHTLWAGKNIDVGTVTYGIDDDANFYVTYDCSSSGWLISETHMFAGPKSAMPLNKPGNPRVGHFPNSGIHNPYVSAVTYTLPLTALPPAEEPGFVVASHCVVHNQSGRAETAWAEGDYTFNDNGWGWYDVYYYNQEDNPSVILYGTVVTSDTLSLYMIDITNNLVLQIAGEPIGDFPGIYDGAAYDIESCNFFFTNYNTGELWINQLDDEAAAYCAGTLPGFPASGTFYNGSFYYVDGQQNTINQVTFNDTWTISAITVLSDIPGSVLVSDIAMSPSGQYLYIAGEIDGGGAELITWEISANAYYSMEISLEEGPQIAYGSDGNLYAIAQEGDSTGTMAYILHPETGVLTPIDDSLIIEDPFTDISGGSSM